MQKPEDMELFPPEEKGFSYLMLFDDYNKIDLTLLPLEELDNYLKGDKLIKVIDLGRSGRADKWYDIAFCVRSIREDIGEEQYVELFFDLLGIKPDWEKIKYYILLDELF